MFTSIQYWMSIRGDHAAAVRGIKSFLGNHGSTCLFCSRYWAFWIWSCVPVMVMMRSSEPSSGSSILMDAPDSWRICLILWPPLPMIEPASCKTLKTDLGVKCLFCHSLRQELLVFFLEWIHVWLTSFGIVTCVVMTGPPISLYEPLPPTVGGEKEHLRWIRL